jgi:hypothetical protein
MSDVYELSKMDPNAFEHLVNALVMRELGPGLTLPGPGADAGRDGLFEGRAPYPSNTENWEGTWYFQAKFHRPGLSKDPQKWLQRKIQEELAAFSATTGKRTWPDIWIVVTNVEPSGTAKTGTIDVATKLVSKARRALAKKFHIWGGQKVIELLSKYPDIAARYGHFLTPGEVLTELNHQLTDRQGQIKDVVRHLVANGFEEQQSTKLEQAGSHEDDRPGIHRLFVDIPFSCNSHSCSGEVLQFLSKAACFEQRIDPHEPITEAWINWRQHPSRARVWFIRGGPGQGKSTVGQYFSQVQRAALILQGQIRVAPKLKTLANEVKKAAEGLGFWPTAPRIPICIELKEYAQWYGKRPAESPRGILSFLSASISKGIQKETLVGTLERMLGRSRWFVVFDGLDEVPDDIKDLVAKEVCRFGDDVVVGCDADVLSICTSRPQGYSGQFDSLSGTTIELTHLSPEKALQCAEPLIRLGRPDAEAQKAVDTLRAAIASTSIRELMATPLQAHIMAVIVRDGRRPPERKWELFDTFYEVIRKRESSRELLEAPLAKLFREQAKLLRRVHNRVGFMLHSRAEKSEGAQTSLTKEEFGVLVRETVREMYDKDVEEITAAVIKAAKERLVLLSTPDDGKKIRFEIRQLQEFFAAECLYDGVDADELGKRLRAIGTDAHWREVVLFLLSALIEDNRKTESTVAISVLEAIDRGEADSDCRRLRQKLAVGALHAVSLWADGVLEQDKQMRAGFENCLIPIVRSVPVRSLRLFMRFRENSKKWLIEYLYRKAEEFEFCEAFGAHVLLLLMMEPEDERTYRLYDRILSRDLSYAESIAGLLFRSLSPVVGVSSFPLTVRRFALRILLDDRWFGVRSRSTWAARLAIGSGFKTAAEVGVGIPNQAMIARLSRAYSREPRHFLQLDEKRFGGVVVQFRRAKYAEPGAHGDLLSGEWGTGVGGQLGLFLRILHFRKNPTIQSLRSCLKPMLVHGAELLRDLSYPFEGIIPEPAPNETFADLDKQLEALPEGQLGEWIARHSSKDHRGLELRPDFEVTMDLPTFEGLLAEDASLGVYVWCEILSKSPAHPLCKDEGVARLFSHLMNSEANAFKVPYPVVAIASTFGASESGIRSRILQLAADSSLQRFEPGSSHRVIKLPSLSLPDDHALLMPLASVVLGAMNSRSHLWGFGSAEKPSEARSFQLRTQVSEAIGDLEGLTKSILENERVPVEARIAGLSLGLLHVSGGSDFCSKHMSIATSLLESADDDNAAECLALAVFGSGLHKGGSGSLLLNTILEKRRQSWGFSLRLDEAFDRWREESGAPVMYGAFRSDWMQNLRV